MACFLRLESLAHASGYDESNGLLTLLSGLRLGLLWSGNPSSESHSRATMSNCLTCIHHAAVAGAAPLYRKFEFAKPALSFSPESQSACLTLTLKPVPMCLFPLPGRVCGRTCEQARIGWRFGVPESC